MLYLPEVCQMPAIVREHAKAVSLLLHVSLTKSSRGEVPSSLWLSIVAKELRWSVSYCDKFSARHRAAVADLLEWWSSQTNEFPDCWQVLVPVAERAFRSARAELDWCAANVDKLSSRRRDSAVDLCESFCAVNPESFRPCWKVLY